MNYVLSFLLFNILRITSPEDSFGQKSCAMKDTRIFLTEASLPQITGYTKLTQTIVFASTKTESHKIEGLIKNITPIVLVKAYAAFLETYNITNINQVVLFVHSP